MSYKFQYTHLSLQFTTILLQWLILPLVPYNADRKCIKVSKNKLTLILKLVDCIHELNVKNPIHNSRFIYAGAAVAYE